MGWSALALALLATPSLALLRFPCSQLVTERLDPLVVPGIVSPHVHQVIGGNAFNITMDPAIDYPATGTCTTCRFKEDKSNYWTAILYFKHPNGTYLKVPQMANHFVGSPNGGMTIYYIQPTDGTPVTSFPPGFRMITGNPFSRQPVSAPSNSPAAWASSFRCWQTSGTNDPSYPYNPGASPYDTPNLPTQKCPAGIRSNLFFPACWDGVNLDTPDHSSHVAYLEGNVDPGQGLLLFKGTCPSSHPVRLPLLFYEIAWDTSPFNDMWPTDGSQPFVMSMGDPTGYGQHGDYVFGWEGDSLQRAMDRCTDISGIPEGCGELAVVQDAQINQCTQNSRISENIQNVAQLPGCNPVQDGPGEATIPASCNAPTATIPGANPSLPPVYITNPGPSPTTNPGQSPTTSPTGNPGNPGGPTVPMWGQCGGNGWTGSTTCVSGSTCTKLNDWYYQCL